MNAPFAAGGGTDPMLALIQAMRAVRYLCIAVFALALTDFALGTALMIHLIWGTR